MKRLFSPPANESTGLHVAALAPMVDLFTILVVAVLRASSPEPPVQVPEPDFNVPLSVQERPTAHGVIIDIGKKAIYVDGWRATSTQYWIDSEEVLISEVYAALQMKSEDTLKIRADSSTDWSLVGKALLTAQQAGYSNIELIALSNASL